MIDLFHLIVQLGLKGSGSMMRKWRKPLILNPHLLLHLVRNSLAEMPYVYAVVERNSKNAVFQRLKRR